MIFGSESNEKSVLAEATPIIFQYISLEQHTPGIFEFEVIFYDKRIPRRSSDVSGEAQLPDHRLEHVIAPDFDVCWRGSRHRAAKQNHLRCAFQEIVEDLVRSTCGAATSAADGMRISANPRHGYTMKVGEKRIYYSEIGGSGEIDSRRSLVLAGSMQPRTVDHNVIRFA